MAAGGLCGLGGKRVNVGALLAMAAWGLWGCGAASEDSEREDDGVAARGEMDDAEDAGADDERAADDAVRDDAPGAGGDTYDGDADGDADDGDADDGSADDADAEDANDDPDVTVGADDAADDATTSGSDDADASDDDSVNTQDDEGSASDDQSATDDSSATEDVMDGAAVDDTTDEPAGDDAISNVDCTFEIDVRLSDAVNVGIVDWSTDLADVVSARVEFWERDGGRNHVAPVDLAAGDNRTLLLGLKGVSVYEGRVVAESGEQSCASEEFELETRPIPSSLPWYEFEGGSAFSVPGFLLTTQMNLAPISGGGGTVTVFDHQGDAVWWWNTPYAASRARMDWAGQNIYVMALNLSGGDGGMTRISMDGLDVESLPGFEDARFDFVTLPDGGLAFLSAQDGDCALMERTAAGDVRVVALTSDLYVAEACDPTSLSYQADDASYVMGDTTAGLYVKLSAAGELQWQLGGSAPLGTHIAADLEENYGHQLLDGALLVYARGQSGRALEFSLTGGELPSWGYEPGVEANALGDVARLSDGSTLLSYLGSVEQVSADGTRVLLMEGVEQLGYISYRELLYGPPQ